MRQLISALMIFAAATSVGATAAAEDSADSSVGSSTSESPAQEASKRFRRGVELYRDGSFDAALAEFNRAYELAPDSRLLYNIGQVHAQLENYVMAVKCFRQYLKDSAGSLSESRQAEVEAEIREFEGRIAGLTVTGNVSGAELLIDGEPMGVLPLDSVRVNAGTRRIEVRKKGFEPEELRVVVSGGEVKSVNVTLEAADASPSSSGALGSAGGGDAGAEGASDSGYGTGFWISAAATTVAVGATATFALLTRNADDDLSAEFDRYPGSASRIDDARSDVKRYALITDICGGLAVVGLASTIYFAVTGRESSPSEVKVGGVAVRTGPVSDGRTGVGWALGGRF